MKIVKANDYDISDNSQKEYKNIFLNFMIFYFVFLGILLFKNIISTVFIMINGIILGIFYFIIHTNNFYSGFPLFFKIFFFNKYDFIQKDSFYKIIEEEFNIK